MVKIDHSLMSMVTSLLVFINMVCGQDIGQVMQGLPHPFYHRKWVHLLLVKIWECLKIIWLTMVGLHLEEQKEMLTVT